MDWHLIGTLKKGSHIVGLQIDFIFRQNWHFSLCANEQGEVRETNQLFFQCSCIDGHERKMQDCCWRHGYTATLELAMIDLVLIL